VAEELLLPELLFSTSSKAPSLCTFLVDGVAGGEDLPDGVPNWLRISVRLKAILPGCLRLRTYKTKLLDQLIVLSRLKIGFL
jgi:hypothetical protein